MRKLRLAERALLALPPFLPTFVGALLWGLATGVSALAELMLAEWETPYKIRVVVVLYAVGGAVAFPFGLFFARFLSATGRREAAFAAMLLSLAAATIAVTAGLFALQYRSYYAEWHAVAFTRIWFLQFAFTVAAALYQFAVLGIRLYFPIGFLGLLVVSAWFALRAR